MKRAFTLIELLVVIAIIGLLSAVVLASLASARAKANDSKRVSDLREVQKALETYANDHNGSYPSTSGSWRGQCSAFGGGYTPTNIAPGLVPTYISVFPADPDMKASATTCCYAYTSDGTDYDMLDYNCSVANVANASLTSLIDPKYSGWSVHTAGAQGKGW